MDQSPIVAVPSPKIGYNKLSIVSLAFSSVGIVLMFSVSMLIGIVVCFVGFVLSIVSLKQIKKSGENGRTYAVFAFIFGLMFGALPVCFEIVIYGWDFISAIGARPISPTNY